MRFNDVLDIYDLLTEREWTARELWIVLRRVSLADVNSGLRLLWVAGIIRPRPHAMWGVVDAEASLTDHDIRIALLRAGVRINEDDEVFWQ